MFYKIINAVDARSLLTFINIYNSQIENIQRFAVRFCFNNYSWTNSVTTMLNKLDLMLLKDRRFRSKSILMYKILNNLIDIPSCYFIPNHHSLRRGHYIQLPARIDYFKFSFIPSVIKIWNSLPSYLTNSLSLNHFCNYLDKYIATM